MDAHRSERIQPVTTPTLFRNLYRTRDLLLPRQLSGQGELETN
jgi:hypothetical protein